MSVDEKSQVAKERIIPETIDTTQRARQKTVLVSANFARAFRAHFKDESEDSGWTQAWEQVKNSRPIEAPECLLPAPAELPYSLGEGAPSCPKVPLGERTLPRSTPEVAAMPAQLPLKANIAIEKVNEPALPIVGFLVSYEASRMGEVYQIREGRWVISSTALGNQPNIILIDDPSISECHAVMRVKFGSIEISDQLSELGTAVKRRGSHSEERLSSAGNLYHGDELRIGGRRFYVCLVEKPTAFQDYTQQPAQNSDFPVC